MCQIKCPNQWISSNLSFCLLPLCPHLSGTLWILLFSSPLTWPFFLFHLNLCPLKKKIKLWLKNSKPCQTQTLTSIKLIIVGFVNGEYYLGFKTCFCGCLDRTFFAVMSGVIKDIERSAHITIFDSINV